MNTIPIVAIPVSICNAIVNEGAIFIFTELADEFWLQSWNKKQNQLTSGPLQYNITR